MSLRPLSEHEHGLLGETLQILAAVETDVSAVSSIHVYSDILGCTLIIGLKDDGKILDKRFILGRYDPVAEVAIFPVPEQPVMALHSAELRGINPGMYAQLHLAMCHSVCIDRMRDWLNAERATLRARLAVLDDLALILQMQTHI